MLVSGSVKNLASGKRSHSWRENHPFLIGETSSIRVRPFSFAMLVYQECKWGPKLSQTSTHNKEVCIKASKWSIFGVLVGLKKPRRLVARTPRIPRLLLTGQTTPPNVLIRGNQWLVSPDQKRLFLGGT